VGHNAVKHFVFALLVGAASATAAAPPPTAPDAYIKAMIENRYRDGGKAPVAEPFDANLTRLMRPDPVSGDVRVDFDPICNCQDYDIGKVTARRISEDAKLAVVEARFVNFGTPVTMRYTLRRKGQSWQVADVVIPRQGSLVAMLGGTPPVPTQKPSGVK
jgi:hypothetical protein